MQVKLGQLDPHEQGKNRWIFYWATSDHCSKQSTLHQVSKSCDTTFYILKEKKRTVTKITSCHTFLLYWIDTVCPRNHLHKKKFKCIATGHNSWFFMETYTVSIFDYNVNVLNVGGVLFLQQSEAVVRLPFLCQLTTSWHFWSWSESKTIFTSVELRVTKLDFW